MQQEVAVAIFKGLDKFKGEVDAQFWKFCYQVARYKIADYWRRRKTRPTVVMDPEELWRVIEATEGGESDFSGGT